MLDLKTLKDNLQSTEKSLKKRGIKLDLDSLFVLDKKRREHIQDIEKIREKQNESGKTISQLKGKEKEELISEIRPLVQKEKVLKTELEIIDENLNNKILSLPNLPRKDVPDGRDEADNKVIKIVGKKPRFSFKAKDYLALSEKLDIIDVKRAAKVSGSRFGYIKNEAARLEFALIQFAFDNLVEHGFKPVVPPVLISEEAMKGMGYLEGDGEQETYRYKEDNLYLVGTSEHSIGPMHMNEILNENDLPLRYVGFSTCFRREAGSYGKDTKGIIRVHQFDKVEMFCYSEPDKSDEEQEFILSLQENFVKKLKLPYRVISVCAGDLSYPSARTYDLECWIPSENKYRETHSTSNCTDYQARRLKIRYRTKSGNKFVHTLNGTAFAIGRTLIAIIENYQQKDGSIIVPDVLQKYCNIEKISN